MYIIQQKHSHIIAANDAYPSRVKPADENNKPRTTDSLVDQNCYYSQIMRFVAEPVFESCRTNKSRSRTKKNSAMVEKPWEKKGKRPPIGKPRKTKPTHLYNTSL